MSKSCEKPRQSFRPKAIQDEADWTSLKHIVVAILDRYVRQNWLIRRNSASITLQNPHDPKEVITVIKDYGNRLTQLARVNAHEDPVIVMIEVCPQPGIIRDQLRTFLKRQFRDYYIEQAEFYIPVHAEHHYDAVILRPGPCEIRYEEAVERLSQQKVGSETQADDIFPDGWRAVNRSESYSYR